MRAAVEQAPGGADTSRRGLARVLSGALTGLLAAGAALGVGELAASFVRPAASPVIAVGNRFIVFTPESVKQWAVRTFGTSDKHVLVGGIYLVLALLAVAVGVLALAGSRTGWPGCSRSALSAATRRSRHPPAKPTTSLRASWPPVPGSRCWLH